MFVQQTNPLLATHTIDGEKQRKTKELQEQSIRNLPVRNRNCCMRCCKMFYVPNVLLVIHSHCVICQSERCLVACIHYE